MRLRAAREKDTRLETRSLLTNRLRLHAGIFFVAGARAGGNAQCAVRTHTFHVPPPSPSPPCRPPASSSPLQARRRRASAHSCLRVLALPCRLVSRACVRTCVPLAAPPSPRPPPTRRFRSSRLCNSNSRSRRCWPSPSGARCRVPARRRHPRPLLRPCPRLKSWIPWRRAPLRALVLLQRWGAPHDAPSRAWCPLPMLAPAHLPLQLPRRPARAQWRPIP